MAGEGRKTEQYATNARTVFIWSSIITAVVTLGLCVAAGGGVTKGWEIALITCAAAFLVGSLVGFLLSLAGDETGADGPFAKIRDAMVAVIAGITGVGLAKIKTITVALGSIPVMKDQAANGRFVPLLVVIYLGLGFYFMYFLRRFVLNSALVASEAELARLQLAAGDVVAELSSKLPERLFLGHDLIEDISSVDSGLREQLEEELQQPDVQAFLDACEEYLEKSTPLRFSTITKAASLYYYRSYYEKDTQKKLNLQQDALDWLDRAIGMDPADTTLSVRKADILYAQGQFRTAATILENLNNNPEAAQYVTEWLGLYLLFVPNRIEDAIRFSKDYFTRFPGDASSPYNAARGYAELYRQERDGTGGAAIPASTNRLGSLHYLSQSIALDPTGRDWARDESVPNPTNPHTNRQWFLGLADDADFKALTSAPTAGVAPKS